MIKKSDSFILSMIIVCVAIVCDGCGLFHDSHIPCDYISKEEHWDENSVPDSTDYCVYRYDSVRSFENMIDYQIIKDDEIQVLVGYFSNFREWMKVEKRLDQYSFDDSCISTGDYYFIRTKEGQSVGNGKYRRFDNYSVYFFDVDTLTLYYIHNNI